jgi:HEAT repeat protein
VALDGDAVPGLVGLLEGKNAALRARAAKVLAQMGSLGRRHPKAIPALRKALKDEDKDVRRAAADALSRMAIDETQFN